MSLRGNAQFAVARNAGMSSSKANRQARREAARDDLYWICPRCKEKVVGTIAELEEAAKCHSQCPSK